MSEEVVKKAIQAYLKKQELLDEKETSAYIKMSLSFLRQARSEGQTANRTPGPPYFKIGRSVRYRIADLDKWLDEHRREMVSS